MCNSAHEITHVDELFCERHSLVEVWVLLALFIPAGIAHLVQRLTERCKIDAGLSPPVRKGTFSQSLTVTVQPPCAIACIKICGYVKNPKDWYTFSVVWIH